MVDFIREEDTYRKKLEDEKKEDLEYYRKRARGVGIFTAMSGLTTLFGSYMMLTTYSAAIGIDVNNLPKTFDLGSILRNAIFYTGFTCLSGASTLSWVRMRSRIIKDKKILEERI